MIMLKASSHVILRFTMVSNNNSSDQCWIAVKVVTYFTYFMRHRTKWCRCSYLYRVSHSSFPPLAQKSWFFRGGQLSWPNWLKLYQIAPLTSWVIWQSLSRFGQLNCPLRKNQDFWPWGGGTTVTHPVDPLLNEASTGKGELNWHT